MSILPEFVPQYDTYHLTLTRKAKLNMLGPQKSKSLPSHLICAGLWNDPDAIVASSPIAERPKLIHRVMGGAGKTGPKENGVLKKCWNV